MIANVSLSPLTSADPPCLGTFTVQLKSPNRAYRTHQVFQNLTVLGAPIMTTSAQGVGLDAYKIVVATPRPCRVAVSYQDIGAGDRSTTQPGDLRMRFLPNPNPPQFSRTARPTPCRSDFTIPIMNADTLNGTDAISTVSQNVVMKLRGFQPMVLSPLVTGCGYEANRGDDLWVGASAPAPTGNGFQSVIEVTGLNIVE